MEETFGSLVGIEGLPCKDGSESSVFPLRSQRVGMELEFTHNSGSYLSSGWDCSSDGSIKGPGGIEYKFSNPAIGSRVMKRLEEMQRFLDREPDHHKVNESCSGHVHLEFLDFPLSRITRLVEIIILTEPLLFWFAGGIRKDNIFCIPWTYSLSSSDVPYLIEVLTQSSGRDSYRLTGLLSKYSSINIFTLDTFGTLEFRHLPGTRDMELVKNWISLCQHVKRVALFAAISDEDLLTMFATGNVEDVCKFLFKKEAGLFLNCHEKFVRLNVNFVKASRLLPSRQPEEDPIYSEAEIEYRRASTNIITTTTATASGLSTLFREVRETQESRPFDIPQIVLPDDEIFEDSETGE